MGERQVLTGYCLLLPDPVVPHLNALAPALRGSISGGHGAVGDALLAVTAGAAHQLRDIRQCRAGAARACISAPRRGARGDPDRAALGARLERSAALFRSASTALSERAWPRSCMRQGRARQRCASSAVEANVRGRAGQQTGSRGRSRRVIPSARSRRACSRCSRDDFGNTIRPPAPTTRCQGRSSSLGATLQGMARLARAGREIRPPRPRRHRSKPGRGEWRRSHARIACRAGFSSNPASHSMPQSCRMAVAAEKLRRQCIGARSRAHAGHARA